MPGGMHVELWRTEDGATWTLLNVGAEGVACISAAGKNWHDGGRLPQGGQAI